MEKSYKEEAQLAPLLAIHAVVVLHCKGIQKGFVLIQDIGQAWLLDVYLQVSISKLR